MDQASMAALAQLQDLWDQERERLVQRLAGEEEARKELERVCFQRVQDADDYDEALAAMLKALQEAIDWRSEQLQQLRDVEAALHTRLVQVLVAQVNDETDGELVEELSAECQSLKVRLGGIDRETLLSSKSCSVQGTLWLSSL